MSLPSFLDRFPSEEACIAHLEALRWPGGPLCPKCGEVGNAGRTGRARYWQCRACRHHFSVLHGTPLEGTHLPIRTWFAALYLVAASSCTKWRPKGVKSISSVKLGEHLGDGQKTVWFLAQRIRRMMEDDGALLRGVVEADEWTCLEKVESLS